MEQKTTLIEDAYQKIKDMIFEQKLMPGQKLVYGDLSESFRMSQTPVINALFRLEHEGFVVSAPFRGFSVKKMDLQEAWDLFGVREALEAYLVEQVVLRALPSDLEQLEQRLAEHAAYQPKSYDRQRFKLDSEFHLQLAALSGNRMLIQQLRTCFEHFYVRFRFEAMDLSRLQLAVDEHRQILDRISRKDIPGARDAIRMHVQHGRDYVIRCLDDESSSRARRDRN